MSLKQMHNTLRLKVLSTLVTNIGCDLRNRIPNK